MRRNSQDSEEAFKLASSAVQALPDDNNANYALLIAAVSVNDLTVARQVDARILRLFPGDQIGHYYAGALAAIDKNWEKAEAELLYSEKLGMDPQTIQGILNKDISRNARIMRFLRWGGILLAFWLLGLVVLSLSRIFLQRSFEGSFNKETAPTEIQSEPRRVQAMYRWVNCDWPRVILHKPISRTTNHSGKPLFCVSINSKYYQRFAHSILLNYFYLSIPLVSLLVVLLAGVGFYAFFLERIAPARLSLVLVILATISMIFLGRYLTRDGGKPEPLYWNP